MLAGERAGEDIAKISQSKRLRRVRLPRAFAPLAFATIGAFLALTGSVEAQAPQTASTPTPTRGVDRSSVGGPSGPLASGSVDVNAARTFKVESSVNVTRRKSERASANSVAAAETIQWNIPQINGMAPNNGGEGKTVAVLSTGVNPHTDFEGRLVSRFHTIGASDNDGNGHGTLIAGVVAGREASVTVTSETSVENVNIRGTALRAKLMGVKVLSDDDQASFESVASGIDLAVNDGADVILLPIGVNYPCPDIFQKAIDNALSHRIPVIAAAGDSHFNVNSTPANCDGIIPVMATQRGGYLAQGTNYLDEDIAAPGGESTDRIISTSRDGGYASEYGSDVASAHVAGLAAILLNAHPNLTVDQLRILIERNLDPLTGYPSAKGKINVGDSLADGGALPTSTPTPTVTLTSTPTSTAIETKTPTPTATNTLIPTPTATFSECSPRPPVVVKVVDEGRTLRVDIIAGRGELGDKQLGRKPYEITNLKASNAAVADLPSDVLTKAGFRLSQIKAGQPVTANLVIYDKCGLWTSFVGGGDEVFRN